MFGSERPMGPVPCVAAKDLWDRSHRSLAAIHGTGPIGLSEPYMGPHVSN